METDLLVQARSGDQAAFATIYQEHAPPVFRYLRMRVPTAAVAEDLTSEAFLRAWRKLPDFRPDVGSFTGWLYTIADNLLRDHRKSARYRRELLDGKDHDGPDRLALARIEAADRWLRLAELSEPQRECVLLRFLAGLSVAEVAESMNKNVNSVWALQHRAARALAASMAGTEKG
ncbi:sigma-70 family RNA polymerase sigma factor [Saccharopolyspora shandongensis]|uniref:RNA polymerase sigma factor n=1 Tax=Saccharopolyspora shandongensis TaxID=418495 RepID=UPI0033D24846